MVRADWRIEHGASSLAVRGSGGTQVAKGEELERRRLGRDRTQDRTTHPDDEEQNPHPDAMVTGCVEECCCHDRGSSEHGVAAGAQSHASCTKGATCAQSAK